MACFSKHRKPPDEEAREIEDEEEHVRPGCLGGCRGACKGLRRALRALRNLKKRAKKLFHKRPRTVPITTNSESEDEEFAPSTPQLGPPPAPRSFQPQKKGLLGHLHDRHLKLVDVAYDGNCFFRAVSVMLMGTEEGHMAIRKGCISELMKNIDFYQYFMIDSQGNTVAPMCYVREMSRTGTWVDDTAGTATANHYGVQFRLVRSDGAPDSFMGDTSAQHTIVLGYFVGRHYVATRPNQVPDLQQAPDMCAEAKGEPVPVVTRDMALCVMGQAGDVGHDEIPPMTVTGPQRFVVGYFQLWGCVDGYVMCLGGLWRTQCGSFGGFHIAMFLQGPRKEVEAPGWPAELDGVPGPDSLVRIHKPPSNSRAQSIIRSSNAAALWWLAAGQAMLHLYGWTELPGGTWPPAVPMHTEHDALVPYGKPFPAARSAKAIQLIVAGKIGEILALSMAQFQALKLVSWHSGQRASTPSNMARVVATGGPKGHMGVKSSAYCVTDSKLMSQYMVKDHMMAHYKKIVKAKSAVDTAPPKAWLVSQKVRDQARRAAMNSARKTPVNDLQVQTARPSSRTSSEADRDEMYAMWASLGEDEIDGPMAVRAAETNTTLEVHPPESQPSFNDTSEDMKFVNRILDDSHNSPSKYHNPRSFPSNIPDAAATHTLKAGAKRADQTFMMNGRGANFNPNMTTTLSPNARALTPRSKDLLDTNANHFTEEKPFQPRTLRTNTQSRLSEFKYYNPPKKRPSSGGKPGTPPGGPTPSQSHGVPRGTLRSTVTMRPVTPMTMGTFDSTDLMMNETLMSRDHSAPKTPTGIPPLDISLDADHMKWLKEQSHKANSRSAGHRGPRPATHPRPSSSPAPVTTATMNRPVSSRLATGASYPPSNTMYRLSLEEEELKYLEFVSDVTNDVLDRGIFTNRVLKQVFQHHLEKRKGELKVSRMRELLLELQRDLGIPPADLDNEEGLGMATMPGFNPTPHEVSLAKAAAHQEQNVSYQESDQQKAAGRPFRRDESPPHYGRPPLPKSRSVGHSRQGSGGSVSRENSREELKEAAEENVGNMTLGMTMKRDGALDGLQAALMATLNQKVAEDEEDAVFDTDEDTHRSEELTNREGATSRADTARSDYSHQSARSRRRASRKDQSANSTRRSSRIDADKSGDTTRRTSRSNSGENTHRSPQSTRRSSPNAQSPQSTRRSSPAGRSPEDTRRSSPAAQSPQSTRRSSPVGRSPESTRRSSPAAGSPGSTRRSSPANTARSHESTRRSSKANTAQSPESTRRSSKANTARSPETSRRSSKANSIHSGENTRRSSRAASPAQEPPQSAKSAASVHSAVEIESEVSARSPPKPSPRRSISSAKAPDTARSVAESNGIESESIGVSELDEDLDEDF